MPKLTLSADKAVIDRAKRLAEERGTSVSAMFSQFIEAVSGDGEPADGAAGGRAVGPITRKARSLIELPRDKTDRQLIEDALAERFGK